ncbi:MFS general substrate transporter [Coprinopsis marcescibilis]|uniref:MFS general substrate transporter n=1 Tax=Coprinopsis marcescibilis TaxID=230819 RepID=A0A5C3L6E9_COPMA|nr:MFS general substrate transporter [Coprinopsis marcescibilis]
MAPAPVYEVPPIYSVQRFATLIFSVLVALASGTNYVYSAYAPQLGTRLGISHTRLNIVALAGNIGVYSTGPIWGRIVDTRGPRILLASASASLLVGYLGMRHMYDAGLVEGQKSISTLSFCVLIVCCYLTGAGGSAGLSSSVNSTAKSFPDQMRATTTGFVISGFGLSAFLFSTISSTFFASNTSSFLLLLGVGTALPMVVGFFLVRPIPLPPHEPLNAEDYDQGAGEVAAAIAHDVPESHSPLLQDDDNSDVESEPLYRPRYDHEGGPVPVSIARNGDVELSPQRGARSALPGGGRSVMDRSMSRGTALTLSAAPNLHGVKLWRSGDFYLLFSSLSLLAGTGIMYINNVGSMSQALYAYKEPNYNLITASKWQAKQVSAISVMNCFGRIFIGIVSDFCKNRYDIPRSYCLVLVAFLCFVSQVVAAHIDHIANLWIASAVLGLGYGSVFSLFPTVCLEWFGMPHFSENWGFLAMSPMFAGNLFSLAFGYIFDKNEDKMKNTAIRRGLEMLGHMQRAPNQDNKDIRCSRGLECYVDSIYLTIGATMLAMVLTIWAGWRDKQKIKRSLRRRSQLIRTQGAGWGQI